MKPKYYSFAKREKRPYGDGGMHESWWVEHQSIGKTNRKNKYLIANEWICNNLAAYLRLPIVPFALLRETEHSERMFTTIRFGNKETRPAHIRADALLRAFPSVSAGILLFDIFVANPDRSEQNLMVDDPARPSRVEVIDFDRALFGLAYGSKKDKGVLRLTQCEGSLGLTMGKNPTNYHILLDKIETAVHFPFWETKIASIPDAYIAEVCDEARELDLSKKEAKAVKFFLQNRKRELRNILDRNKSLFPRISHWEVI